MAARFFNPTPQFFDATGRNVLSGGKIFTYANGTTTPQDTWKDAALSVLNTNPIILGADGRPPFSIFADDADVFSILVKDSADVVVTATIDDVSFVSAFTLDAADVVAALTANAAAGVYNGSQMTGTAFGAFASPLVLTAAGSIDTSAGAVTLGTVTGNTTFSNNLIVTGTTTHNENVYVSDGDGLVVGHSAQVPIGGNLLESQILGTSFSDSALGIARYSNDSSGPILVLGKSRGATIGSIATVQTGDGLANIWVYGADSAGMTNIAATIAIDASGTIGINRVPGQITIKTATNAASSPLATALIIDNAQRMTLPNQPAFMATASAQLNATGNNNLYTVVFANERFDRGANFNGTSTFTAPVTGLYALQASVQVSDITAATADSVVMTINTSNNNYTSTHTNTNTIGTVVARTMSIIADMDAGDTAYVQINVIGMAGNTADIDTASYFSGMLVA